MGSIATEKKRVRLKELLLFGPAAVVSFVVPLVLIGYGIYSGGRLSLWSVGLIILGLAVIGWRIWYVRTHDYDEWIDLKSEYKSATTGRAGGLKNVNRSKRLGNLPPPEGGGYSWNMINWSRRLSSSRCFWMYSRMLASSRPTVET